MNIECPVKNVSTTNIALCGKATDSVQPLPISGRFNPNHPDIDPRIFEKSEVGQQLRLDQLKGRWVAIITSGFELTKCVQYEDMRSLGLKIFLVEHEDNPVAIKLEQSGIATHVKVDLTPTPDLVERVVTALEEATTMEWNNGERPNTTGMDVPGMLAGCWTIWDDGVCLASRVQASLDLRGDVPDIIDTCHDKYLARKRLEKNGVIGPRSILLRNLDDVHQLATVLNYPIVLKPVNGAASIGVHFFNSHSELVSGFPACQEELRGNYDDDELMGLVFQDSSGVTSADDLLHFCAEEFIGGAEYDVDILFSNGTAVYTNIGEDWKYKEGWMCERGMHHPASLPKDEYKKISDAAVRMASTLGCTTGVFHVEMKDDPNLGPQMIECNPRMGGGPVYDFHRLAWNVNLIVEAAFAFIGLPCNPIVPEEPLGCAISLLLFSDKSGTLREDIQECNRKITENKRTTFFLCPGKKGEEIRGWLGDRYPTHLGRVDFFVPKTDEIYDHAIEWGLKQRSEIIVPLLDGDHRDNNDDALGSK